LIPERAHSSHELSEAVANVNFSAALRIYWDTLASTKLLLCVRERQKDLL